jgi:hypothetical protein
MRSFTGKCACCGLALLAVAPVLEHESMCPRGAYCRALPPEQPHGEHKDQRQPSQHRMLETLTSSTASVSSTLSSFIYKLEPK